MAKFCTVSVGRSRISFTKIKAYNNNVSQANMLTHALDGLVKTYSLKNNRVNEVLGIAKVKFYKVENSIKEADKDIFLISKFIFISPNREQEVTTLFERE